MTPPSRHDSRPILAELANVRLANLFFGGLSFPASKYPFCIYGHMFSPGHLGTVSRSVSSGFSSSLFSCTAISKTHQVRWSWLLINLDWRNTRKFDLSVSFQLVTFHLVEGGGCGDWSPTRGGNVVFTSDLSFPYYLTNVILWSHQGPTAHCSLFTLHRCIETRDRFVNLPPTPFRRRAPPLCLWFEIFCTCQLCMRDPWGSWDSIFALVLLMTATVSRPLIFVFAWEFVDQMNCVSDFRLYPFLSAFVST